MEIQPVTEMVEGLAKIQEVSTTLIRPSESIVIRSHEELQAAADKAASVKRFRKELAKAFEPAKEKLNDAKAELMKLFHRFDDPAAALEESLKQAQSSYQTKVEAERQARIREEEQKAREKAAREQRQLDEQAMVKEVALATEAAVQANIRGQKQTATEIDSCLFSCKSASDERDPLAVANTVRQAVANALAREKARIEQRQREVAALEEVIDQATNELNGAKLDGYTELADEISKALSKIGNPSEEAMPLMIANQLRSVVGTALRNEATRVELAATKSKKEKQRILDEAKKAAPVKVEEVKVETVEAAQVGVEAVQTETVEVEKVKVAETPKVIGGHFRTYWRGRVIDPDAVDRRFLMIDQAAIDEFARVNHDKFDVPGIVFYSEEVAVSK